MGAVATLDKRMKGMTTAPQPPDPSEWSVILTAWAMFGVFLGNILAFVFTWYTIKDRTDLIRRVIGSSIVGAIASVPAMELWLNIPIKPANIVLVFASITFVAWPLMGGLVFAAAKWSPKK